MACLFLQGLCLLFAVSVPDLVSIARVHPPLLVTSLEVTQAKVEALAEALAVSVLGTTALLRAAPRLFTFPPPELRAQLDRLAAYFQSSQGLGREGMVALLAQSPELLGLEGVTGAAAASIAVPASSSKQSVASSA